MSIDASHFITQSLAPAFVLSGVGLLTVGLHNRLLVMAGRIRELNKEARDEQVLPERYENVCLQVKLVIQRIHLVRNALFLLYGSMGLMVLTAISIALNSLWGLFSSGLPTVWAFLTGLVLILVAVVIESFGVMINLKTLELDTLNSQAIQNSHENKNTKNPPQ